MTLKTSDCFLLGSISKTHGVDGRLIIRTEHNLELIQFEEPIFVIIDGLPVPLFFEEIVEKTSNTYIAKFEMIDTPEYAKQFVGCEVLAPKTILSTENINLWTQILGVEVHDKTNGFLGICSQIEPIPGNPLIVIEASQKQLFIPIADELIIEFIPNKRIVIDCPPGLLNI